MGETGRTEGPHGDSDTDLEEAVRRALTPQEIFTDGWDLGGIVRRSSDLVEVHLRAPDGGPGIGLEWGNVGETGAPAFRRGARYRSSYRKGPGLWNIDDGETPEEIRQRAWRACEALAGLTDGPDLTLAVSTSDRIGDPGEPEPLEVLAQRLEESLKVDLASARLPGSAGWILTEVRIFERWAPVVEVLLGGHGRTLGFIVSPTDPERPAFRRTPRYDLVYYSDDLTPSEHDDLYLRDRETIDGFALWLRAWDQS